MLTNCQKHSSFLKKQVLIAIILGSFFYINGLTSSVKAEPSDIVIDGSLRLMYSFFERTNICLKGANSPKLEQFSVQYDRKSQRLIYKSTCSIQNDLSSAVRYFEYNILQSDIQINYKNQFKNSLYLNAVANITTYDSDSFTIDKTLVSLGGNWGSVSLGVDKHWLSDLIVTGYIDGGSGNISDDSLVREKAYPTSREYGASYAPHKILPLSYSHNDPRLLATFTSGYGLSFGTGVAFSPRQEGPERDGNHLSLAFVTRYDNELFSGQGKISTSISVVARPFLGDDRYGKYRRVLLTGATQFGLKIDYKNTRYGLGFSYSLNSANAFSGKMCLTQGWQELRSSCRDKIAFQVSAGYVFRNVTFGGGVFAGFMKDAVKRNEIEKLFKNSETLKTVSKEIYDTDSYIRFGIGADVAVDENVSVFIDSIYTIDYVASDKESNKTNDSYSIVVQGGIHLRF